MNLTNADVRGEGGRVVLPRGTLHITRSRFIWDGVCYEMIRVRNFALSTVSAELVIRFGSDFENIVDVRAQRRVDAARSRFERVERDSVTQGCLGADEIMRETVVDCHTAPEAISADSLRYRLQIGSRGEKTISLAIGCRSANHPMQIATFTRSLAAAEELARADGRPPCQVQSTDAPVQRLGAPRRRRHRHDADGDAAGTHARGGPAVARCGLRSRRHHHRARRHCGCGRRSRATCCAISPPRSAPTAPPATAPRPARYSTSRAAAALRLTTTAWTPRRCS